MPVVVNLMDKNSNTTACISGILIILNALQGEDYKLITSKAQLLTARLAVKVLENNTSSDSTNEFLKLFFVWFQFEVIHCSNNWLQKKCQSGFNKRQAPVVVEVVSDGIWRSQTWCWNLFLKIKHNYNIMNLWVWILLNHIYDIIYVCIYALSNEKAITCSKTYDNKRRTQDTPARSSEKKWCKRGHWRMRRFYDHQESGLFVSLLTWNGNTGCLEWQPSQIKALAWKKMWNIKQIMSFCFLTLFKIVYQKKDLHQKWYLAELTVFHMSQALRYDQSEEKEQCWS